MRYKSFWILFLLLTAIPLTAESWYVRRDGGTRYSANNHSGQCDGKADTPARGKGANQHCAFGDVRWLWQDGTYTTGTGFPAWGWVGTGGDTYIIRGSADAGVGWRIGWQNGANSFDPEKKLNYGLAGDPYGSGAPPPPSGSSGAHTRILGENYAGCTASNKTQLFGGFGASADLDLRGAHYVDIVCIELTRHSQCIKHGVPAFPAGCKSSIPMDDYDGSGIVTNSSTHDVTLTDVWIHGHTDRGIIGPIGANITCLRCNISYNGMAGWDFDDGNSAPYGVNASWNFLYSQVEWNGCNQEYPITHPFPAISCYGQSTGGYGDGVGSPTGTKTGMSINVDHSTFRYNTQDGLDLLHIDAGNNTLNITNSESYSNNGAQFKWGANFQTVNFANNIVLANCLRMSAPIPGTPSTFNKNLEDFCRAQDGILMNFNQNSKTNFLNNTIISYAPTTIDINCSEASCSNSTLVFKNNIVLGYENSGTYSLGGKPGGPGGLFYQSPIGNTIRSNNILFGLRGVRCITLAHTEHCDDPKFVSQPRFSKEQDLDQFNFHLSPGSPALHSGASLPEVRTDHDGKSRPSGNSYSLGALEN